MSDEPIRVLLADDHPVYRDGLAALLSSVDGIDVVGTAGTGREAVAQASELQRALQAQRAFPRAKAGELLELLRDPPDHPDFEAAPKPFSRDEETALERLKAGIEAEAATLAIEPALLAPRKAQEARLRDGMWPSHLPEWRRTRLDAIAARALG